MTVPGGAERRPGGTVQALLEDPVRARLREQDVETVAVAGTGEPIPAAEAARRLEVLLDLLGCLASRPTGFLLDPAYHGLLDEEETALSAALTDVAAAIGAGAAQSRASLEVLRLLRELGHAEGPR